MLKTRVLTLFLLPAMLLAFTACQQLPGTREQQGAVIGGASGAAAGAIVGGEHHRLLGALLGGALGATGGYLIGANTDKVKGNDTTGAQAANASAQSHPATPEMARSATTADLNHDGYVTMDEVVAMKQAGFSDQEMIQRLQATGQIFELTQQQQQYLVNNGVSQNVVNQMNNINRAQRDQLLGTAPISQPNP